MMNPYSRSTLRVAAAAVLALASLLSGTDASARQWFVESGGSQVAFSPQFLTIKAGDSVTFVNLGGNHNAVADDGSFRCAHGCDGDGKGGNGNASSNLWTATVSFPNAGVVGYFCEPHGSPGEGMYGTITVVAPPPPDPAPAVGVEAGAILALVVVALAALRLRKRASRRWR